MRNSPPGPLCLRSVFRPSISVRSVSTLRVSASFCAGIFMGAPCAALIRRTQSSASRTDRPLSAITSASSVGSGAAIMARAWPVVILPLARYVCARFGRVKSRSILVIWGRDLPTACAMSSWVRLNCSESAYCSESA